MSQSFLVDDVHGVLGAQDPIHRHLAEAAAAAGNNISLSTLKTNTVIINKSYVVALQNTVKYFNILITYFSIEVLHRKSSHSTTFKFQYSICIMFNTLLAPFLY